MDDFKTYLVPTLTVSSATAAIEFYSHAFDAIILMSNVSPDGTMVAEMSIGDARIVVADESPEHGNYSPEKLGGVSIRIGLMVADPDSLADRAIKAGAIVVYPVSDQDYGYRLGHFIDPFGHHWEIGKPL